MTVKQKEGLMSPEGMYTALLVAYNDLYQAKQNVLAFELALLNAEFEYTGGQLNPAILVPYDLPTGEKLTFARQDLANSRVALAMAERQWTAVLGNARAVCFGRPDPVLPLAGGPGQPVPVLVQPERPERLNRGRRSFKRR